MLLILCCLPGVQILAAEEIIFRTAVTPENPWVGQRVQLHVDVLAKDGWAQLKKITDAEIEGAYLLRLETQGTRLNETIDGDSYTGQRYEFMLFAQRGGEFLIPPAAVDVEIRSWGAGGGTRIERMSLPTVEFVAQTPPGAEGIRGLISTTDFTATQSWSTETDGATVGDAIKRTITLRATDVSAMAFTPLRHSEIENVGIYSDQPDVEDKFARGDLTGTRIEAVTYVLEQPGDIVIPAILLSWWDVRNTELKHIELPGLSVHVVGGESEVADAVKEQATWSGTRLVLSILLAIGLGALLALRFGSRFLERFAAWRKARSESEANYFRQVMRSARSGDQYALLRDTMHWLDRINDGTQPARLDQFIEQYGDAGSQIAAGALTRPPTADQKKPNLAAVANGLAAARTRWHKAQRIQQRVTELLPGLNSR